MTEEEIKKAKERIAKLLNMTVENGCSEDEAENAMRMAAGLAARVGISLEAVRPAGEAKPKINEKRIYKQMKVYESFCTEAAAVLYGVDCYAPNYGKNGFWFTGREENIELAEQTQLWLVSQVEQLYKQALPRGLSKRDRAEFRGSFKDACAERIYSRARELIRKMKTDQAAAQEATGSNALVVAGYFDMLKQEIRDYEHEKYVKPIEDRQRKAAEERTAMLAAMTEEDRVAFLQAEEDARKAAEKKASKPTKVKPYKAPRTRNPKRGSGTGAGWTAGDTVQLRQSLK